MSSVRRRRLVGVAPRADRPDGPDGAAGPDRAREAPAGLEGAGREASAGLESAGRGAPAGLEGAGREASAGLESAGRGAPADLESAGRGAPAGFDGRSGRNAADVRNASEAQKVPPAKAALAAEVLAFFDREHPDPRCGLNFADPFQLLTATILSAQCTDERVNLVTPALFRAFPDPQALAEAPPGAVEELVKSCGLYRNKAANLRAAAKILTDKFQGRVPRTLEELTSLPGVGRKTANVVLGDAFGVPGLTVDTHLGRVSRRLGLSERGDPAGVEQDLMVLIPQKLWTRFSHQAIAHGRTLCRARSPLCSACGLASCPSRAAG